MNCVHGYAWGMCPYGCCQHLGVNYQYCYPTPIYQCSNTTDVSGAIIKTLNVLMRREMLKKELSALELAELVKSISGEISNGSV